MTITISSLEIVSLTIILTVGGAGALMWLDAFQDWWGVRDDETVPHVTRLTVRLWVVVWSCVTVILFAFAWTGWRSTQVPQGDTPVLNTAAILFMVAAVAIGVVVFSYRAYRNAIRSSRRREPEARRTE